MKLDPSGEEKAMLLWEKNQIRSKDHGDNKNNKDNNTESNNY